MIFHSAARIQFFPLRAGQRSASDRQRAEREREMLLPIPAKAPFFDDLHRAPHIQEHSAKIVVGYHGIKVLG